MRFLYIENGEVKAVEVPIASGLILENKIHATSDYTMGSDVNGVSVGPVVINSGVTVTIPSGSIWKII